MSEERSSAAPSELQTVARAAQVLLAFRMKANWTVSELARHLGISKSMAHRLLSTLGGYGFVTSLPEAKGYRIGPSIAELNRAMVEGPAIVDLARAYILEAAQRTAETISFCMISGSRGVCIDYADSPHAMRMTVQRGEEYALNAGAIGKCLLAFQSDGFLADLEASGGIRTYTENTITDPAELRSEIARIRRQGIAYSNAEITPGACSVGVPVFEEGDRVRFCIAASGPSVRFHGNHLQETSEVLKEIGSRLSAILRSRPSIMQEDNNVV